MAVIMEEIGARYDTAENGLQAVEMATSNCYDVIMMDMNMPVMDGYTATKTLRDQGYETPIIALTAHAMSEAGQKCIDVGCSGYLSKPVNLDELIRLLADIAGVENIASVQMEYVAPEPKQALAESTSTDEPLKSTLDTNNPRFRAVVGKFIGRLPDQLELMTKAIEEKQFEELQSLAHWMKGSGPNVGYAEFATPAKKLEGFARERNLDSAVSALVEIRKLSGRAIAGFSDNMPTSDPDSASQPVTVLNSTIGSTLPDPIHVSR